MLMLRLRPVWLKLDQWKLFFTITFKDNFMSKSRSGRTQRLNLYDQKCICGKTLIYGFPCSHIIIACQHRCVDFRLFVQGYYTTQSYYDTWSSLFHPIFNEDE